MKGDKSSSSLSCPLTLEEYVDFFHGRRRLRFTVDQLNTVLPFSHLSTSRFSSIPFPNPLFLLSVFQIIFMHGFVRMHRRLKMDIVKALEGLTLTTPTRSTLGAAISSDAALTLEEVKEDLKAIGWFDCHAGSFQPISASPPPIQAEPATTAIIPVDAERQRKKIKRAPRGVRQIVADRRIVLADPADAAGADLEK